LQQSLLSNDEKPVDNLDWLSKDKFTILQTNCQSLPDKFKSDFSETIERSGLSVVLCSETWLEDSHRDAEIHVPGYKIIRHDRKPKHWGTVCYVKEGVSAVEIDLTAIKQNLPCEAFKIATKGKKSVIVLHIYRAHKLRTGLIYIRI
jgi:hypothetical protein